MSFENIAAALIARAAKFFIWLAVFGVGIAADRLFLVHASGEPLAFAGALVGAGSAVAGSMAVAEWQAGMARREQFRALLEAIDKAIAAIESVCIDSRRIMRGERPMQPLYDHRRSIHKSMGYLRRIRDAQDRNRIPVLEAAECITEASVSDLMETITSQMSQGEDWTGDLMADAARQPLERLRSARGHIAH